MRMPEIMRYNIEELDKGYVYTNLGNNKIRIEEELARDYFTIYTSRRAESYTPIDLVSYHVVRQRETTRLTPSFITIFLKHAKKSGLANKLDRKVAKVTDHIPIDGIIHLEKVGTVAEPVEVYKNLSLAKTATELELAFKYFIQEALHAGDIFPEQRSVGRVCTSIYHFFSEEMKMNYEEKQREIMTIVMSDGNAQPVKDVINESLKEYREKHPKGKNEVVENDEPWNIPIKIDLNVNHTERKPKLKRAIMNPFYD